MLAALETAKRLIVKLERRVWEQELEALKPRLRSVEALVSAPVFQEMLWRAARLLRECRKPVHTPPCEEARYHGLVCTSWTIMRRRNGLLWPAKVEIDGCRVRVRPLETLDEVEYFLQLLEMIID